MKGVPILVYHQVVGEDFDLSNVPVGDRPYYLRKRDFIQQMECLFDQGFKSLTLGEFVGFIEDGGQLATKSIVLTFDDGHISNYTHVYPILRRFNFRATFFLIVGKIGEPQALKWAKIARMVDNGMEIGSHTMTHPFLSDLKTEEVFREFKRSKKILETHFTKETDFLSIPRELPHPNCLKIARDCGYKAVCTSYVGLNNPETDLFALKRIGIRQGLSPKAFSRIVNGNRKMLFRLRAEEFLKQRLKNGLGQKRWLSLREKLLEIRYKGS